MLSMKHRHTLLATLKDGGIHGAGLLVPAGVNAGPRGLRIPGKGPEGSGAVMLSRLHGHGLSHDGAPVAEQLQLGHGAAARRRSNLWTSRSRQSAQRGGGRLLQEGAHGLGLAEDGIHGCSRRIGSLSVLRESCLGSDGGGDEVEKKKKWRRGAATEGGFPSRSVCVTKYEYTRTTASLKPLKPKQLEGEDKQAAEEV